MKVPLAALLIASFGAVTTPGIADDPFDYAGTAAEYFEEHDIEDAVPGNLSLDQLLVSDHFVRFEIGSFETFVPSVDLRDKDTIKELKNLVGYMLTMQARWAAWQWHGQQDQLDAIEADVKSIEKWIKRWSSGAIKKAGGKGGSWLDAFKAKDDVRAAVERFGQTLTPSQTPASQGAVDGTPRRARIVLLPKRRTYIELVSVIGVLHPAEQDSLWEEIHLFGTNVWAMGFQIVPLEYPAYPQKVETALEGWAVEKYVISDLKQHVAERFASSLLGNHFFWHTDPFMETAMVTNLVIETIGEIKIINDFSTFSWSRAGGSTGAYSRFVPGGNPAGGTLPARKASQGPLTGGSNVDVKIKEIGHSYYKKDLARRQKDGAKAAAKNKHLSLEQRKRKEVHFALESEGPQKETYVVSAPFLGDEAAESKALPPHDFLDAYEDFFSIYRANFLEWLRTEAADDSEELFAQLLASLSVMTKADTFGKLAESVYGEPLGWSVVDDVTLEGRYLAWLLKQK